MTIPSVAWKYTRQRGIAVISALLLYRGIVEVISALKYQLAVVVVWVINPIILTGFRDRMLLREPFISWRSPAVFVAAAMIPLAIGILFGVWAFSRSKRHTTT